MKIKENHEFIPPLIIRNRHIQSIMNSLGPRKFQANKILNELKSRRVVIKTKKDVRLIAEHTVSNAERPHGKIKYLVVLLHGWEGSSVSAYMVTTTNTLLVNGFDVLRLNFRDHGDSHYLNKELLRISLLSDNKEKDVALLLQEKIDYKYELANRRLHNISLDNLDKSFKHLNKIETLSNESGFNNENNKRFVVGIKKLLEF